MKRYLAHFSTGKACKVVELYDSELVFPKGKRYEFDENVSRRGSCRKPLRPRQGRRLIVFWRVLGVLLADGLKEKRGYWNRSFPTETLPRMGSEVLRKFWRAK